MLAENQFYGISEAGAATMRVGQFGRPTLSKDGRTITVHIPIKLRHQGGRKQVVTPSGATPWIPPPLANRQHPG